MIKFVQLLCLLSLSCGESIEPQNESIKDSKNLKYFEGGSKSSEIEFNWPLVSER